ncbi:MAG: fumarylacetoacetate hydrolase family protein [Candidatus Sulfotelmatobacter sp.]
MLLRLNADKPAPLLGAGYSHRQSGNTKDFIFPLDMVIRFISQAMTLLPGDLIATGTPAGVGPVVAGDAMEISVEGVGVLRNSVVDE